MKRIGGRSAVSFVAAAVAAVALVSGVSAAGGVLDPAFGSGGWVVTDFPTLATGGFPGGGEGYAAAVSTDGSKIVVAGEAFNGGGHNCAGFLVSSPCGNGNYDWALTRYNADGTLDTSFGIGGRVVTAALCRYAIDGTLNLCGGAAHAVAIANDGSVFVGGDVNEAGGPNIARIAANGRAGKLFAAPANADGEINAIALTPSGIVGAGWVSGSANVDVLLARWTSSGALDPTFGQAGVVDLDLAGISETFSENLFGVVQLPNGKILAAGYAESGSGVGDILLVRLNHNGTLDSTFGSQGVVRSRAGQVAGANVQGRAFAVQPDGKIVVAGLGGYGAALIARFNANGTLDRTFAQDGVYTTFAGAPFVGVVVDAGGGIDAAQSANGNQWRVRRLTSTGAPDTSFGPDGDGTVTFSVGPYGSGGSTVAAEILDCAGRILVGGSALEPVGSVDQNNFAAARLTAPVIPAAGCGPR